MFHNLLVQGKSPHPVDFVLSVLLMGCIDKLCFRQFRKILRITSKTALVPLWLFPNSHENLPKSYHGFSYKFSWLSLIVFGRTWLILVRGYWASISDYSSVSDYVYFDLASVLGYSPGLNWLSLSTCFSVLGCVSVLHCLSSVGSLSVLACSFDVGLFSYFRLFVWCMLFVSYGLAPGFCIPTSSWTGACKWVT